MFGVTFLLVAGAALVCANLRAPPYVQSREAFTYVRTSLAESLRPNAAGIENPARRKHHSFGILAGVVGGLVMANKTDPNYNPLLVVDKYVPYAWKNYNEIALRAQALMNEASAKTLLIEDLIDNLCDTQSPAQCNLLIEQRVLSNSYIYKLPAQLLLLLGVASNTIRRMAPVIDSVTTGRTEIPYLINNVQKPECRAFVTELENAYKNMRQLHFRRFFGFGSSSNNNNNNNNVLNHLLVSDDNNNNNILPHFRGGSNNNNNNNNIHFRGGDDNNNNNNNNNIPPYFRGGDSNNNNNNILHHPRSGNNNNNNNNNIQHDSYII